MNEPPAAVKPQMPGPVPVAVLVNPLIRLPKIFPETDAVTPIPVTSVFIAAVEVALRFEMVLPEITCPAMVAELKMPVTAELAGVPVSTEVVVLFDAVNRFEIKLPETVEAKAPETFIPCTCAFTPVEDRVISFIILLLSVETDVEDMPV